MRPIRHRISLALSLESRLVPAAVYATEALSPTPVGHDLPVRPEVGYSPNPDFIGHQVEFRAVYLPPLPPAAWVLNAPSLGDFDAVSKAEARFSTVDPDFAAVNRMIEDVPPPASFDSAAERLAADIAIRMNAEVAVALEHSAPDRNIPAPAASPKSVLPDYFRTAEGPLPEAAAVRVAVPRSTISAAAADDRPNAVEPPTPGDEPPTSEIREPLTVPATPLLKSLPAAVWELLPSAGEIGVDLAALEAGAGRLAGQLADWGTADLDTGAGWDRGLVLSAAFVGISGVGCALRTKAEAPARRLRLPSVPPERDPHDSPAGG